MKFCNCLKNFCNENAISILISSIIQAESELCTIPNICICTRYSSYDKAPHNAKTGLITHLWGNNQRIIITEIPKGNFMPNSTRE